MLGGIGFTWEHDAHLYLRRAMTLRQLARRARRRGAGRGRAGSRSAACAARLAVDLPDARPRRSGPRCARSSPSIAALAEGRTAHGSLADAGLPRRRTGPRRGAATPSAVEQLVIDEEFRAARRCGGRTCRSARGRCRT